MCIPVDFRYVFQQLLLPVSKRSFFKQINLSVVIQSEKNSLTVLLLFSNFSGFRCYTMSCIKRFSGETEDLYLLYGKQLKQWFLFCAHSTGSGA